jgi:hypothetical protein
LQMLKSDQQSDNIMTECYGKILSGRAPVPLSLR